MESRKILKIAEMACHARGIRRLTGEHCLLRRIVWDPPELLFPCGACEGRGEYVGLLERDVCRTCAGRKVVPV